MHYSWLISLLWLGTASATAQTLPGAGNCLAFNGTSTQVICGTSNRGVTSRVTVEAWTRTTTNNNQWLVGKYINQGGVEAGYHLATWNGLAVFNGRAGVGDYLSSGFSNTNVADGRWHHLAGVCDNNVWRIYVDGVLENSTTYNYPLANLTNAEPLTLGDYQIQGSRPYTGEIDEVRIWNVARTGAQLQEAMCHKFTASPAGLVAYFRLDEATGTTVRDASTQAGAGSLVGFSSQPWHASGAALGDRSICRYDGIVLLSMPLTTADSVSVTGPAHTGSFGTHLYVVDQAPSVSPPGYTPTHYVGVFTLPALTLASYLVVIQAAGSCVQLHRRDHSALSWAPAAITSGPPATVATTDTYRGEYASGPTTTAAPTILGDTILCPGLSTTLQVLAPGATGFTWNTGATTPIVSINQPGTYSVAVTYSTGCTASASWRVSGGGNVPAFSLGTDTVLCIGQSFTLRAPLGPGLRYLWSDGSTGASLTVRQAGLYTVRVSGRCDTHSASRQVSSITPIPAFTIGADTVICASTSLTLHAPVAQGLSYRWSDGSTGSTLLVGQAGGYSVEVRNQCGVQTASRRVDIAPAIPTFSLGPDTTLCGSETELVLTGPIGAGFSYQWSTGLRTASLTLKGQTGTYRLTVNGPCGESKVDSVTVGVMSDSLFIANVITPDGDGRNDLLEVVDACTAGAWAIDIYSRWGRLVYSATAYNNKWNGDGLSAGTYYYHVRHSRTNRQRRGWLEVVR